MAKIVRAVVMLYKGPDICWLIFDVNSNMWPGNKPLTTGFECLKGTGEEYIKSNFPGIPVEVIRGV